MSINAALANDVPEMMRVRFLVKENVLSNPALVTPDDCLRHITTDGFGFCWHEGGQLLGFSIANHIVGNVWALFVDPAHEGRGIGRALHNALLDKYFASHEGPIWLSTDPGTRADRMYAKAGWVPDAELWKGERRYWMTKEKWLGS